MKPKIYLETTIHKDPIVEEVRRAREAQAAKHHFDIASILMDAKKRQRRSGMKTVSFVPKQRRGSKIQQNEIRQS